MSCEHAYTRIRQKHLPLKKILGTHACAHKHTCTQLRLFPLKIILKKFTWCICTQTPKNEEEEEEEEEEEKRAVANRLRRRTSDQTVLGSNPAVTAALSPWTRLFTPIVPRRSLHISFY